MLVRGTLGYRGWEPRKRRLGRPIAHLAMWLLAFSFAEPVAAEPTPRMQHAVTVESDVNLRGRDFRDFELQAPDPMACRAACEGEARCAAYTYVPPGGHGPGRAARCWLKEAVPTAIGEADRVSGRKVAFAVRSSWNLPGEDVANFPLAEPDAGLCRDLCAADGRCVAYTYVRPGIQGSQARCWVKDALPAGQADAHATSGVRGRSGAGRVAAATGMPPQTTYEQREAALMRDSDQCGPGAITDIFGDAANGPFGAVCKRHDACYRLGERSQRWCDDRMSREMDEICDPRSWPFSWTCASQAAFYEAMIRSTYGGYAYGGGAPQGEIVSIGHKVIGEWFSDDEVEWCVTVRNPSKVTQEYDVEVYARQGELIDREPDSYEFNVEAGGQATECVSTNGHWVSQEDLPRQVVIALRADTPDSFRFWDDIVVVDAMNARGR